VNTLRFAFVNFARDWKSGEQAVMAMALLVAVAALTAIAFFTNRIALGVEQQAGEVLAADIRIESQSPYYEPHAAHAADLKLSVARTVTFPTVVYNGERSVLAALHAVSSGYPMRGRMKLARTLDGAVEEVQAAPAVGEVWADARVLAQLDANVGDSIELGSAKLIVTRVLIARPDVGSQFAEMLPGAIFSLDELPATELIKPGSRPAYAMLFAGAPTAITQFKEYLNANRQPGERITNIADASPQLRESMNRAGSFLNLASMVSVLLSAIAVAMAARRYAARRMDVVALMKSMGASQARVLTIYIVQLLIIALLASLIGTVIGYLAQEGLAWLLKDLLQGELPEPTFEPALLGLGTAFTVLVGFALPPLLQLKKVPPVRVLRRDVGAPPMHNLLIYGLAIGAVIAVVAAIVRDGALVRQVVFGLAGTFATLYLCGWGLVRALAVVRGRVGVSWRYGVANIARRGRESVVQVVAFGLGLMVLLLLIIVRNDLLKTWRNSLPADAPNQFIINIQPSKVEAVREFFIAQGLPAPTLSPMASARMTQINDVPIVEWRARYKPTSTADAADEERRANDNARNASERQANLSWVDALPDGNKIVAGKWWSANDGGGPRISVEVTMARSLHVKVGDRIAYDFAGETITATIANLRAVKWDSFRPNYFIVFSPGVIDHAVGTYITSTHVPPEKRATMRDFMRRFPEATAIDIDAALAQVRSVMDKVSLAVEYVSAFTLFAGITVLFAAIQATRDERRYESAMLRTLGASRRVVLLGVASEFGVLGVLSGVLAAAGATLVGYLLAAGPFNLDYSIDATVWLAGMLAGIALVGIVGTLATYSVVNAPPVETLRRGA
jgi:putative ABC transport system permease protein